MKYHLSKRQLKELEQRASELRIAIPHPPDDVDPVAYARDHLDVPSEWIRRAEVLELTVAPEIHRFPRLGELATVLGSILHDDSPRPADMFTVQIVMIVAVVSATDNPRHRGKTQWAAAFGD